MSIPPMPARPTLRAEHAVVAAFSLVAVIVAAIFMHFARLTGVSMEAFFVGIGCSGAGGVAVGLAVLRAPTRAAARKRVLVGSVIAAGAVSTCVVGWVLLRS